MSKKYFVVAGNKEQYLTFIKKKCEELYNLGDEVSLSHFIYVNDINTLKGHTNPIGWFIGNWRERKDINEIIFQLMLAKSDYIKTEEFTELIKEWRKRVK